MAKKLFEPGKSGNPNGRPRGSANKTSAKIKDWVYNYIESNEAKFKEEINSLTGKEYVDAIIKLFDFVLPKLQRLQHTLPGNEVREVIVTFNKDGKQHRLKDGKLVELGKGENN